VNNQNEEKEFFDTGELARYLNVSKKSVEKWRGQRLIQGTVKIGRVYRFRRIEIEKRLLSGRFLLDKVG
jgi:excisionase family DNA binding protein